MRRRLVVIALLATALALLTVIDEPVATHGVEPPAGQPRPAVPPSGATSSTWYCAAGSAGAGTGVTHDVVLLNPTGDEVGATLTTVVARGDEAATPPTTVAPSPQTLAVPPRSAVVVPVGSPGASVLVEFDAVGPVVTHRIVMEKAFDEAPCATGGSEALYFPTANTDTTNGSSSQLWLFNPFPADVSVDVQVSSEDGVRTPGPLRGLVVAGGSSRVIEVGRIVQTRDQFAMALRVRGGVVIAEQSQLEPGGAGLMLTPGVPAASDRLAFADGRSGSGIGERYVIFNPGDVEAAVLVSVVPFDTDLQSLPEKFDLAVPPRRYTVLDIEGQARVPADRPHWVRVESVNGEGIVVQRMARVLSPDSPWGLRSGTGGSVGQTAMSRRWLLPWADRSAESTSTLVVVNPSTDTIAKVKVSRIAAGRAGEVGSAIELAPGGGLAVDLGAAGSEPAGIEVRSSAPVIVERRVAAASGSDLAVIPAVGRVGEFVELPSMSHVAEVELEGD